MIGLAVPDEDYQLVKGTFAEELDLGVLVGGADCSERCRADVYPAAATVVGLAQTFGMELHEPGGQ